VRRWRPALRIGPAENHVPIVSPGRRSSLPQNIET
jgi:hypothetical protein